MKHAKVTLIASVLFAAVAMQGTAQAVDYKLYGVGGCQPYTTGTPNYNLLRFRPESVQNQSNGYLYVLCPIVRDSETSWGSTGSAQGASVSAYFRTNTTGTFQCTLNIGSNYSTLWTSTKSVAGSPGEQLLLSWSSAETGASNAFESPAALLCRLPPKGSIVLYSTSEVGSTQSP